MTPVLKEIWIYPIKSLSGISLPEAVVEEKGFRYDRRWMLVAPNPSGAGPWQFLTQREHAVMALLNVELTETALHVYHRQQTGEGLMIPLDARSDEEIDVTVWDDTMAATTISAEADAWFSRVMGFPCRLVRMPETTRRLVDPTYAKGGEVVSFADGYPYLLIGQSALDELNRRLDQPLEMLRFRPNLVVEGLAPYEEDTWYQFRIGALLFHGVKPCARCVLTTVDPQTGTKGKEPLRTLATYRRQDQKIYFGQNVLPAAVGTLRVGDSIDVLERRPARLPFH